MVFKLSKPKITNIEEVANARLKTHWQFWALVVMCPFLTVGIFLWLRKMEVASDDYDAVFVPSILVLLYGAFVANRVRASFWKQFAKVNGWKYKKKSSSKQETGVMFKRGIHSDSRDISNIIEGKLNSGRQFRIFTLPMPSADGRYNDGKKDHLRPCTVFGFKFDGIFPHVYLNNENNHHSIYEVSKRIFLKGVGEKINLPQKFQKEFSLFAPKKYEMEALAIFTPDVFSKLLDIGLPSDVELVNQEVLIFTGGFVNSFRELEKEFNLALEIEDLLDERLDRFKFNQIGDLSHRL